ALTSLKYSVLWGKLLRATCPESSTINPLLFPASGGLQGTRSIPPDTLFARQEGNEFPRPSMKLNPYLLRSTIVAALGGLLFGFDTAVIPGTTHALPEP